MAANCHIPNASTTLHTETLQIPILLIFVISQDKPACDTGTHLHLAPPCICCLQMGQSQPSTGAARGFWPCLIQNRLPINFPWINLMAELGVLPYFLRLSLAHLPSGRAGTSGWHQTVIFPSSSSGGLYLLLLGHPLAFLHPGGFCKSVWAREDVCIQMDEVWVLCPKYQSNLVRVWKTDDTHSGTHSHPETIPAGACVCSFSGSPRHISEARI